jgi:hypothetical protein
MTRDDIARMQCNRMTLNWIEEAILIRPPRPRWPAVRIVGIQSYPTAVLFSSIQQQFIQIIVNCRFRESSRLTVRSVG